MRATRAQPELADRRGWTYNHAPFIAYWGGQFHITFISSPKDELGWPTHSVLVASPDGRQWTQPRITFPAQELSGWKSQIHQRMGFYVASNGRLLALTHYGTNPRDLGGPGYAVREIREGSSLGEIHFISFGEGWSEANAFYPFYAGSTDKGFLEACEELRANRFVRDQWFEESLGYPPELFAKIEGPYDPRSQRKALSFYRRKDGKVVALWKSAWVAVSSDEGETWSQPVKAPGVATTFAKLWGQRTADGRYALVFCPQDSPPGKRWPLAVATSDDGETFSGLLTIHGEVPLRRYSGLAKDIGAQYVRGIGEGNGDPPGSAMWLTYSVNKEDIWVSRVPVPVRSAVTQPVADSFDDVELGHLPAEWNIYSPAWAPVEVAPVPSARNRSLRLQDSDPYDYARAIRVFPASSSVAIEFKMMASQSEHGRLEVELLDATGRQPVRIVWSETGQAQARFGPQVHQAATYEPNRWMACRLEVDVGRSTYSVILDGKRVIENAEFAEPVESVERISFRTGPYRPIKMSQKWQEPIGPRGNSNYAEPIDPDTDRPIRPTVFYVDDVRATDQP